MRSTAPPLNRAQSLWLLATGIAACAPLVFNAPPWLAALTGAAFVWRAALAGWQQPLPTRWVLVVVALAGAAGVFLEYRTLFGQRAGVGLLLIFMALKQLEARTPRDGLVIVLLAYFLTLAQFFDDQALWLAVTLGGTVLIATATLSVLVDARAAAAPRPLLRRTALLLAQALPLMLVLFLLFPRVSGPLWGLPSDAYSGLTGMSDSMSPGSLGQLARSGAIAFRVDFSGAPPPQHLLYWRGPVLPRLDGRTWRPALDKPPALDRPPYTPAPASPAYRYTVTLEAHNQPWLFALELPTELPAESFITPEFQLHARKIVRERHRYTLTSQPQTRQPPESAARLQAALDLPDDLNPRSRALAAAWRGLATARQRVDQALAFLRAQQLTYTLRPPLMGAHVADEFLFEHRRGFCEHFAASFVVLLRAAGVPARVVTGYQGGARNPVDNTWVIRQSDAHAWAEVWLDDSGWQRIDPTAASAPARIDEDLAAALPVGEPLPFLAGAGLDWLKDLRFRWWAVNNAWNQWVLGFDAERQRDLLERLGMASPDWRKMAVALALAGSVVLLGLAVGLLRQAPRRDPVERLWQSLLRRLARHPGLAHRAWEGPQDYARRVAALLPATAAEIDRIAALYGGLRYGKLDASALTELRRRVAAFKP